MRRGAVPTESRSVNTAGTMPFAVCTSAGSASNSDGKKPPSARRVSCPSARISVTWKPISSMWATNTTGGPLSGPAYTQTLPAVSMVGCAQAGSSRRTSARTESSWPEGP